MPIYYGQRKETLSIQKAYGALYTATKADPPNGGGTVMDARTLEARTLEARTSTSCQGARSTHSTTQLQVVVVVLVDYSVGPTPYSSRT